jgi:formylglycine-generating enzyme required for sulfatase activity
MQGTLTTRWPLSQDYNEAIQNPALCFADEELGAGQVITNALGLPMPRSGNFADVYEVHSPATGQRWAVKCFTRAAPGLRERYAAISDHLRLVRLRFAVDFQYLEQGIRVGGQWYRLLKMDWVEGLLLNEFVRRHLDRPAVLEALAHLWAKMGRHLRRAAVAHGDLQHGNVLLVPGPEEKRLTLKLIDYDGMWVPTLAGLPSGEVGHPAYQHPQRLREATYNAQVDRFPLLAIYIAIRALIVAGRPLWDRYDNGDNLLFRQQDFEAPNKSALFYELLKLEDPDLHSLVEQLIDAARNPLEQTPLFQDVIKARLGPSGFSSPDLAAVVPAPPPVLVAAPAPSSEAIWYPDEANPDVAIPPGKTIAAPETGFGVWQPDGGPLPRKRAIPSLWIASGGAVALLGLFVALIVVVASKGARDSENAEAPGEKRTKSLPKEFKNSLGMEFVLVPAGRSWLGGGGGKPGTKEVVIPHDFYLGKYEVTQEQWQNVMGTNPSHFSRTGNGKVAVQGVPDEELKRFPVESVTWPDTQEFVKKVNERAKEGGWVYRLPREVEWEYACRGGPLADKRDSTFDWYFDKPTNQLLPEQANFNLKRTCKVGSYRPNPLGLYDMHGNVWEWCDDTVIDMQNLLHLQKGDSQRVERGGCWHDGPPSPFRRTSARISFPPSHRVNDHGLRLARVPVGKGDKERQGQPPASAEHGGIGCAVSYRSDR